MEMNHSPETSRKRIIQESFEYSIDETSKTAKVVGCEPLKEELIIPLSVQHESNEYKVISISDEAFFASGIKSIQFPQDSELRTIERNAFSGSSIEKIMIPASLVDLKEGWCSHTEHLKIIEIDPRNPRYSYFDNKFIIGKSIETSETYDILVFSRRDIRSATISSFIKTIESHSFSYCTQLQHIDFLPDSKLRTIGKYAFSYSQVENILIPSHATQICENAFSYCTQLQHIEIPQDSELRTIERNAFSGSSIEKIMIPASLVDLEEGWCSHTEHLKIIEIDPRNPRYSYFDSKFIIGKSIETSETYDILVFSRRDIKYAIIPSFIKTIESHSFSYCIQLQHIEIPQDSELRTIERNAFSGSSIEKIMIPASLVDLEEGWCSHTEHLKIIEIDSRNPRYSYFDNKFIIGKSIETSETYDILVFSRRDIRSATIPSFIKTIESHSFSYCTQLQYIDFLPDSKLRTIGKYAFFSSFIENILIPSHVTQICENAFSYCTQLRHIEIPQDSKLQTIGEKAFFESTIENITIPSHVTQICKDAFSYCKQLQCVEIPQDSELKIIGECAFSNSSIKSIVVTSHVTQICKDAFSYCKQLQYAEIPQDSELQTIGESAFFFSSIKSIVIPSHISQICKSTFSGCTQLRRVEISQDSKLQAKGVNAFTFSLFRSIVIPSHITKICENAFSYCTQLRRVEISQDSELQTIGDNAFSFSSIESIVIPSHVTQICEKAFSECFNLQIIEVSEKSNVKALIDSLQKEYSTKYSIVMIPV